MSQEFAQATTETEMAGEILFQRVQAMTKARETASRQAAAQYRARRNGPT